VLRATVHYSGHVQGVGFRWRVRHTAEDHGVVGYVSNLRDGRVLLVAEADPETMQAFLDDVGERLGAHIAQADVEESPATGEFAGFLIRRW
jgi:acylphosphatase